jgi:hypothetical protein
VKLDDVEVTHKWTNDAMRQVYEACGDSLRELLRRRAVDLGQSMDDGDEVAAFELLKMNRRLRMSDEHRAEVWRSYQEIIDPIVKRMADIHMQWTVPQIIVKNAQK